MYSILHTYKILYVLDQIKRNKITMISNIHKAVINELQEKKPRQRILNDLIVSFCAVTLNELRCKHESVRIAILRLASTQLEYAFKLIQNYQDFLNDSSWEKKFADIPDDKISMSE